VCVHIDATEGNRVFGSALATAAGGSSKPLASSNKQQFDYEGRTLELN